MVPVRQLEGSGSHVIARESLVRSVNQASVRGEEAGEDGAPQQAAIGLKEGDQEGEHWVSWLVSH